MVKYQCLICFINHRSKWWVIFPALCHFVGGNVWHWAFHILFTTTRLTWLWNACWSYRTIMFVFSMYAQVIRSCVFCTDQVTVLSICLQWSSFTVSSVYPCLVADPVMNPTRSQCKLGKWRTLANPRLVFLGMIPLTSHEDHHSWCPCWSRPCVPSLLGHIVLQPVSGLWHYSLVN